MRERKCSSAEVKSENVRRKTRTHGNRLLQGCIELVYMNVSFHSVTLLISAVEKVFIQVTWRGLSPQLKWIYVNECRPQWKWSGEYPLKVSRLHKSPRSAWYVCFNIPPHEPYRCISIHCSGFLLDVHPQTCQITSRTSLLTHHVALYTEHCHVHTACICKLPLYKRQSLVIVTTVLIVCFLVQ